MPYYRWKGVELTGRTKKGQLFAQSLEHLDELLLKREIALTAGKPIQQWFKRPIKITDRAQLFAQLATLIDAGVLIPDALTIVANQVDHVGLQKIMHDVASQVHDGQSLSTALEPYPQVANQIMIQLIRAGEESGNMAQTLNALCNHLMATSDFYRRLRSALLLPAITLLFFFGILMVIFIVIMPRFIDVFSSMGRQIPPLTQKMLAISEFIRSPAMGLMIAVMALLGVISWRITRKGAGRRGLNRLIVALPLVGNLLEQRFLAYSMQAIAVLIEGGMPLLEAISVVRSSVQNHVLRGQLESLEQDVENGAALSSAMARHRDAIFSPDVIAMVEVAEASGRLPVLLNRVSQSYYSRVTQRLSFITLMLQPAIMIFLGLLVALLIFAVYGPIFSMSSGF